MLYYPGRARSVDANGDPVSNAKLSFYLTLTVDPAPVYADFELTVEHTQPVRSNAAGFYPPIYFDPAVIYKSVETTADDVSLPGGTVDPANTSLFSGASAGDIGAILYPRTEEEIAADVTPADLTRFAQPWLWVRREGCVLDGTTDDYEAFGRCISVAASTNMGLLIDGPMLIGTNITVPKNVTLWFVGNGRIKPAANRTVTLNCRIEAGHQQIFDISASSALIAGRPVVEFASVCWFGAIGDNVTDDTVAVQRVHDFCKTYRIPVRWPTATFLITDSILLYKGCHTFGTHHTQYNDGFGAVPAGTTIRFVPASLKDLFAFQNNGSEFLYHVAMGGFFFQGSTNAQYCIDVNGVIYGHFSEMAASGFSTWRGTIRCFRTIENTFRHIFCTGTVQGIRYSGGSCTTDVWERCSFFGTPIGINMVGNGIAIQFDRCLFEQCDNYGAYIVKDCENIQFMSCYAEDVPYTNNAAGAVFKIGHDGTSLVVENNITVIGGKYSGRNAGTVGSFFDSDYLTAACIGAVDVSRFTNVLKATTNTQNTSISVYGISGIGYTNFTADATTAGKVVGMYPSGVLNSGGYTQFGSLGALAVVGHMSSSSASVTGLAAYADDAAAAIGGIAVGQLYRTSSAVKVRVS